MAQEVDAIIVGAGQAGLAVSYFLTQQGRSHLILEQSAGLQARGGANAGTRSRL